MRKGTLVTSKANIVVLVDQHLEDLKSIAIAVVMWSP